MRAPSFWWKPASGRLLSPFGAIYGAAAAWRMQAAGQQAGLPVICLGNLTVGGSGKTPAALAVALILLAAHERPFFLSRGYGGRLAGPVLVNPSVHGASEVGDEPLLLARLAPTVVARNRVAGAQAARFAGAGVIVMDDGFQNPSLHKDVSILVVDGRRSIGNGRIIPAGPLRAPFGTQIARAQALLIVGADDRAGHATAAIATAAIAEKARHRGLAIFHGRLEADREQLEALRGRRLLAFAGIADPAKFFATLDDAGLIVAERRDFADHHRYTAAEARALIERADSQNLMLLTTEKDHVRLAGEPQLAALAARAAALPVRLVIDEEKAFRDFVLGAARRRDDR